MLLLNFPQKGTSEQVLKLKFSNRFSNMDLTDFFEVVSYLSKGAFEKAEDICPGCSWVVTVP